MRVEHIALNVPDSPAHVQWYVDHLSMRVIRKLDANQAFFIVDESGQVVLELYTNPNVPVPDYAAMQPQVLHIALSVDDMNAERDRLIAAGAVPDGDITHTPAGDQLAYVRDPWGVCLQLARRQNPMI